MDAGLDDALGGVEARVGGGVGGEERAAVGEHFVQHRAAHLDRRRGAAALRAGGQDLGEALLDFVGENQDAARLDESREQLKNLVVDLRECEALAEHLARLVEGGEQVLRAGFATLERVSRER